MATTSVERKGARSDGAAAAEGLRDSSQPPEGQGDLVVVDLHRDFRYDGKVYGPGQDVQVPRGLADALGLTVKMGAKPRAAAETGDQAQERMRNADRRARGTEPAKEGSQAGGAKAAQQEAPEHGQPGPGGPKEFAKSPGDQSLERASKKPSAAGGPEGAKGNQGRSRSRKR